MQALVERALAAPADYSPEFTRRVAELREDLAAALDVPVEHDADMNYASAQRLAVYLTRSGAVADAPVDADFRLHAYVSSRGPLFALVALHRQAGVAAVGQHWRVLVEQRWPEFVAKLSDELRTLLVERGLQEVPSSLLTKPAPNHVTEMDSAPADTFQVLFSELIV